MLKFISKADKNMANGMRNTSGKPLSDDEIEYVKQEIKTIGADESKFVFNDPNHMHRSTCYDFLEDKVYVTRNIFPDNEYGSIHPRDIMSVRAVIAHEYYGHRTYRDEYLADMEKGQGYHTTEIWQDECRASITAAKITPNLSEIDKRDLILDAVYRADESLHYIEMDDFMKGVLYPYGNNERNISTTIERVDSISTAGEKRIRTKFNDICFVPKMSNAPDDDYQP